MRTLLNMYNDRKFQTWLCTGMSTCNKPLHMWWFTGWKAVKFLSTPHSTQFQISAPLTLHSHHHRWGCGGNTKGKLKKSKVSTCWILLLLCTRLRAWGCHWYKVWTFPPYEARTWKSTGGHRVRENTTPALRLKCGLKAIMEKGRAALSGNCLLKCYIRMTLWKCITFSHTTLSTLSKASLL